MNKKRISPPLKISKTNVDEFIRLPGERSDAVILGTVTGQEAFFSPISADCITSTDDE